MLFESQPVRGLSDAQLAPNSPPLGQGQALVVMSNGNGGRFGGHHDTDVALASAGLVVATLPHSHDHFRDQSRSPELPNRLRQLQVLVGYRLAGWPPHGQLDPGFGRAAFHLTFNRDVMAFFTANPPPK